MALCAEESRACGSIPIVAPIGRCRRRLLGVSDLSRSVPRESVSRVFVVVVISPIVVVIVISSASSSSSSRCLEAACLFRALILSRGRFLRGTSNSGFVKPRRGARWTSVGGLASPTREAILAWPSADRATDGRTGAHTHARTHTWLLEAPQDSPGSCIRKLRNTADVRWSAAGRGEAEEEGRKESN